MAALLRRIAFERGKKNDEKDCVAMARYVADTPRLVHPVYPVHLRKNGNQIRLTYFLGPLSATSGDPRRPAIYLEWRSIKMGFGCLLPILYQLPE